MFRRVETEYYKSPSSIGPVTLPMRGYLINGRFYRYLDKKSNVISNKSYWEFSYGARVLSSIYMSQLDAPYSVIASEEFGKELIAEIRKHVSDNHSISGYSLSQIIIHEIKRRYDANIST
jgi:hypothetical protein